MKFHFLHLNSLIYLTGLLFVFGGQYILGQETNESIVDEAVSDVSKLKAELVSVETLLNEAELTDELKKKYEAQIQDIKTNIAGVEANQKDTKNYQLVIEKYLTIKSDLDSKLKNLKESSSQTNEAQSPGRDQQSINREDLDSAKIENEIAASKSKQTTLKAEQKALDEIYTTQTNRPVQIEKELSELKLQSTGENMISVDGETDTGSDLLGMKLNNLHSDSKKLFDISLEQKLNEELNSHPQRYAVLQLRREIKSLEIENLNTSIDRLSEQLKLARDSEARQVESEAELESQKIDTENETIIKIRNDNVAYASEKSDLTEKLSKYESLSGAEETAMETFRLEFDSFQREIGDGGSENIIAEVLLDSLQRSEQRIQKGFSDDEAIKDLRKSKQQRFKYERLIAENIENESIIRKKAQNVELNEEDRVKLLELLSNQLALLRGLEEGERKLALEIAKIISIQDQFSRLLKENVKFINRHLMWVPTARPVWEYSQSMEIFKKEIPAIKNRSRIVFSRLKSRQALLELTITVIAYLLVMGYLLVNSKSFTNKLNKNSESVRRISTDKFTYTFQSIFISFILPFRVSLVFLLGSIWLFRQFDALSMGGGLAYGLLFVWISVHWHLFIKLLARRNSVFDCHFKWKNAFYEKGVANLQWFLPLFSALGLIIVVSEISGEILLREIFIAPVIIVFLILIFFYYRSSIGPKGLHLHEFVNRSEVGWLIRFCGFWKVSGYVILLALILLSASGYQYAAYNIGLRILVSGIFLAFGLLVYFSGVRWFLVKERRVALEKALEKRRAQIAQASEEDKSKIQASHSVDDADEFDLSQVQGQTRRFVKSLFSLYALFGVWLLWADFFPALEFLEQVKLWSYSVMDGDQLTDKWISLFDVILLIVVIILTTTAARNIPGVIEIILLERLPLQAGVRYAVTTVFQYLVVAAGLIIIFNALGFKFEQFSWILAALSLGLGFGLQEVVANFVCGILLLLERPIRVGDIVTVGGTTGVVSKIRIRATTVTDWDKKEFIVPNKEFITGKILNWTLSNKLNRVVIKLGVAYGTNLEHCFKVTRDILESHDDILSDPSPMITFDGFLDSSLSITIRFFLANLDRRLGVTNEIHTQIHDRFMQEKIEIPFPQRDINITSDTEIKGPDISS